MIATAFDEENFVLGPPPEMTEEQCHSLSVFRGLAADGTPIVVSCWKPTKEEIVEIQRTGRVWLTCLGISMPPVEVSGFSPWQAGQREVTA